MVRCVQKDNFRWTDIICKKKLVRNIYYKDNTKVMIVNKNLDITSSFHIRFHSSPSCFLQELDNN